MKIRILILLFLITTLSVNGQMFSIETNENILYRQIPNPIKVVVENKTCNSYFITTDNGEISGDSCFYIIYPAKVGSAIVTLKTIIESDTIVIGKESFRVRDIPKPIAYISGCKADTINKNKLVHCGVLAKIEEPSDIDAYFIINSYTVIIKKSQDSVFIRNVKGSLFPEEIKQEILKLNHNDKVYIVDIFVTDPNGKKEKLNSIDINIE